jgi:hypothetical protein
VDAVSAGLSGTSVLSQLFTDMEAGLFSSHSPHTDLLWALEGIAWSPDHFGAAVDLLARLDEVDPGGRLSNRPFRSLSEIFCPWHPETSVTPDRRLKVVDSLIRRHNGTAWKLLISMLPESHGTHFPTHSPDYRDWKPTESVVLRREYFDFVSEVVARCVTEAGVDGERWQTLLDDLSNLPPDDREMVLVSLRARIDAGELASADADKVWAALRSLVGKHREFADADWALPEDALVGVDELIALLSPGDALTQHQWLFQDHMPHLGDITRRDDYAEYEALLAERRADAVRDIEVSGGLDAILSLVRQVEVQWAVGQALATASPTYDRQLLVLLGSDDATDLSLAGQYFFQRFRDGGWTWLSELLQRGELGPLQHARLLLAARDFPRAWEEAAAAGPDVADAYWKLFVPYGLGGDFAEVALVAENLLRVGRCAMAVDFLHMYMSRPEVDVEGVALLIAQGLEGILRGVDDPEIGVLSSYDFETSFELLERHRDLIGVDRLASLEWGLLPALGHDPHAPALNEGMAENPEFFVEVVSAVYRRRSGGDSTGEIEDAAEEVDDDSREARARNGYRLLSSWNHVPGLVDGVVDPYKLQDWLSRVQPLLEERGRLEVGLVHFGHVLASAPPDVDGSWPPRVVRDLLEDLRSDEVESGLSTEIFNRRGVTSRGLEEGGAKEEALAAKYRSDADAFGDEWPRTTAILRRIARSYEADARRNDDDAERFRRGLQ